MITLTRINGTEFVINAEYIEYIEASPDTLITLTNGHKYFVIESVDEVKERVLAYKRNVQCGS